MIGLCSIGMIVFGALLAPPDVSAISGNGALTAGVNAFGRVGLCRWPSPGYFNQMSYKTISTDLPMKGVRPQDGLQWGFRGADTTRWLRETPWIATQRYAGDASTVIETVLLLPDESTGIVQRLFAHGTRNLLIARIRIKGPDRAPVVFWSANFTPCTRLIPELPVADWALDACNDFAAFSPDEGKTMCHFRPTDPGAGDWAKAESLSKQAASGDVSQEPPFGEGVWIAYGTPNVIVGFQCGRENDASSAYIQADAGTLAGARASTGPCNSALALIPEAEAGEHVATIFVAFGKTYADARETLAYAMARGYDALQDETDKRWRDWLEPATLPSVEDPETLSRCKRDLLNIGQCFDQNSGAVVRSPVAQPPMALDWARHGAWMTLALDLAGYRNLAEANTMFHAATLRRQGAPGKPCGSLPAACYANHVEAIPHVVLEADATAWMLGAQWRHASFLDGPARRTYLTKVWDTVSLAADFLAGWTDARTRDPYYSFDERVCRDTQSPDLLLATYMGMDAALRVAEALGSTLPAAWERRKRDLDALIRFNCVDKNGQWKLDETLPFWQPEIAQTELPAWGALIDKTLIRSDEPDIRFVCDAALAWEGRPDRLARLRPFLNTTPTPPFPDALDAAFHFVAASKIYAPPEKP